MAKFTEQTSLNSKAPWLNPDGTKKSDKEISRISKTWTPEIWNQYLDSDIGTLQDDELVFIPDMNSELITHGSDLLEFLRENNHYEVIEDAFALAIDELSRAERKVIKKLFWEDIPTQQLATELGTSEGNIRVIKSRALQKLKSLLPSQKLKQKLARHKNQRKQSVASETVTLL